MESEELESDTVVSEQEAGRRAGCREYEVRRKMTRKGSKRRSRKNEKSIGGRCFEKSRRLRTRHGEEVEKTREWWIQDDGDEGKRPGD